MDGPGAREGTGGRCELRGHPGGPGPVSISTPGGRQAPPSPHLASPQPQSGPRHLRLVPIPSAEWQPSEPWRRLHKSWPALKGWTPGPLPPGSWPTPSISASVRLCWGRLQPPLALSAAGKRAQGTPPGPAAHSGPGSCPLASQSEAPRPPVSHSPRSAGSRSGSHCPRGQGSGKPSG